MRLKLVAPLLFVAFSMGAISVRGQYVRVGVNGPIPIGKLDEMEDALTLADKAQKTDLLTHLGVDPASARNATEEMLPSDKIQLIPIRTSSMGQFGIAFVPSSVGGYAALYLLKAEGEKSAWAVVDHVNLDCWHRACLLDAMPRSANRMDDVLLRHINVGHGSDYVEDMTQGFIVRRDKLQKTLSASDYLTQTTAGAARTIERTSEFLRFPDDSLEETQTVAVNQQLRQVRRRFWKWSKPSQRFLATNFVTVSRSPAH
jgi:hypothetical protein